jgi:exopolysaccharide production protein ExoQ
VGAITFLICGLGIAGLFYLDRDKSVRTSKALWIPVMWLWIAGSRSVSTWLGAGGGGSENALTATLDGSPMDAAIFELLIFSGVVVLFQRKKKTIALLRASGPLVLFLLYCLMSTAWSPFHVSALKRWTKAVGDLVMALLIVTDAHPTEALRRFFSRVGFVLLPLSVELIKFTNLGVAYDELGPHYTGVTTNKNTFGLIVWVLAIGALWNVRALLLDKKAPYRTRRLVAQGTFLLFGIALLQVAHSATSIFCFVVGGGLLLATSLRAIRTRPNRVHILCLGTLLTGGLIVLFGGQSLVTGALGRDSSFSGRTEIWKAAIAAADSPLLGTGFESFWNVNNYKVAAALSDVQNISFVNSAHNGFIQIYLDLGWIGVCLLSLILIRGYIGAGKAFQRDREVGCLALAFIITCSFYSLTEAGFRILTPTWICLLLAVASVGGVNIGLFGGEKPKTRVSRGGRTDRMDVTGELDPKRHIARPFAPVL